MGQFENYYTYVSGQANDFVEEYFESAKEWVKDDSDLQAFIEYDGKLHNWVDNDFIYVGLRDSADIIEQSQNVETDSGLWEGQEPVKAIETQAFFTYRNDLYNDIKDAFESKFDEYADEFEQETIQPLKDKLENLQEELKNVDDDEEEEERITDEIADLEESIDEKEDELENYRSAYTSM